MESKAKQSKEHIKTKHPPTVIQDLYQKGNQAKPTLYSTQSLLLTKKNDITDNKEREEPALFLVLFEFTEANLTELQRLDEGEIKVNNVIQTENF